MVTFDSHSGRCGSLGRLAYVGCDAVAVVSRSSAHTDISWLENQITQQLKLNQC